MKKRKFLSLLLAAVMTLSIGTTAFAAQTEGITVNGRGVVSVAPDTVTINTDIVSKGKTSSEAQSKNNELTASVISAMKKIGIQEDKILTEYSYIRPVYTYDENGRSKEPVSYEAFMSVSFETKDVDNAGKYIDAALKAGAENANAWFSLENPSLYYGQALQSAVKTAGDSAKAIADALGVPLGAVQSVVEQSTNTYNEFSDSGVEENLETESMDKVEAGGGAATVIRYDDIQISARVTVTYGLN